MMETPFKTVFQLQTDWLHFRAMQTRKISLGCPVLDAFLRGGLPVQGVNEITGESGSGKTQIGIQLSCASVQSQSGGAVAYVCTEDTFPVKRLRQMQDCRPTTSHPTTGRDDFHQPIQNVMDKIFLEHVNDVEALIRILETKVPILIDRHDVKLVVIDSVAAVYRCENEWSTNEKAQKLCFLASLLHRLNREREVAIVCINQVTDVFSGNSTRSVQPSLGLAWANFITTRIMLSKASSLSKTAAFVDGQPNAAGSSNSESSVIVRRLDVLLSPNLPRSSRYFFVNSSGVHGIQDKEL